MNLEEKTIKRHDVFSGNILNLHVDDIQLPNGKTALREVVDHPGAVCVAALTKEKELLFVTQYRYSCKTELLELPAGKLERGITSLENAKKELREETGAIGENYLYFGKVYSSPGFSNEVIHLYFCQVDYFEDPAPEDDEFLNIIRIPISRCINMVKNAEITDEKTQLLILRTAMHLGMYI